MTNQQQDHVENLTPLSDKEAMLLADIQQAMSRYYNIDSCQD